MNIEWEQKIGYSFVGLMAGNLVSILVLSLLVILPLLGILPEFSKKWHPTTPILFLVIAMVSMLAWVLIGLPTVLLLRAEIVADFYRAVAAFIGAILGASGMLLFYVMLDGGLGSVTNPGALWQTGPLFADAALIGAVAFAVYCSLVKRALRKGSKENGAPGGTPRSLAWFDF